MADTLMNTLCAHACCSAGLEFTNKARHPSGCAALRVSTMLRVDYPADVAYAVGKIRSASAGASPVRT